MTILDSNAIIYLSKGLVDIDEIICDNEEYAVSVITYMEVLGYAFESEKEEKFINDLLALLHIKYLNSDIVQRVITLRKMQKIKLPDAIICATAISENAYLLTNDSKLKTVKNLKVKDFEWKAIEGELEDEGKIEFIGASKTGGYYVKF